MSQKVASEPSFEEIIAGAKRDIQESQQIYARHKLAQKNHWERLVGPDVEDWLNNRATAEAILADPNPKRRLAALEILLHHWKPDPKLAAACEKMVFDDPDGQVRVVALFALGICYNGSLDFRIGKLLASIVNDAAQPENFRKAAYTGLFHVRGLPVQSWPDPTTFRPDRDVDWAFVQSFLAEPG